MKSNTQIFPEAVDLLYDKALQDRPQKQSRDTQKWAWSSGQPHIDGSWWWLACASILQASDHGVNEKGMLTHALQLENQGKTGWCCLSASPKNLYSQDHPLYSHSHEHPCSLSGNSYNESSVFMWPFCLHSLIQICPDCLSCSSIWSFVLAQLPNSPSLSRLFWMGLDLVSSSEWIYKSEHLSEAVGRRVSDGKQTDVYSSLNPQLAAKPNGNSLPLQQLSSIWAGSMGRQRERSGL